MPAASSEMRAYLKTLKKARGGITIFSQESGVSLNTLSTVRTGGSVKQDSLDRIQTHIDKRTGADPAKALVPTVTTAAEVTKGRGSKAIAAQLQAIVGTHAPLEAEDEASMRLEAAAGMLIDFTQLAVLSVVKLARVEFAGLKARKRK